ncbi:proline-rich protein 2-like [Cynocephalus volans]|uniref:proline-rich protein 2-like n=1 Tax=Cynocephalus volans TaxID=110931 RepID=UPI002FC673C3
MRPPPGTGAKARGAEPPVPPASEPGSRGPCGETARACAPRPLLRRPAPEDGRPPPASAEGKRAPPPTAGSQGRPAQPRPLARPPLGSPEGPEPYQGGSSLSRGPMSADAPFSPRKRGTNEAEGRCHGGAEIPRPARSGPPGPAFPRAGRLRGSRAQSGPASADPGWEVGTQKAPNAPPEQPSPVRSKGDRRTPAQPGTQGALQAATCRRDLRRQPPAANCTKRKRALEKRGGSGRQAPAQGHKGRLLPRHQRAGGRRGTGPSLLTSAPGPGQAGPVRTAPQPETAAHVLTLGHASSGRRITAVAVTC